MPRDLFVNVFDLETNIGANKVKKLNPWFITIELLILHLLLVHSAL